jgi:hypothetical protein
MRVKLGLTNQELMKSSWISLCLQMNDYPYFDYKSKEEQVITGKAAREHLKKYVKK